MTNLTEPGKPEKHEIDIYKPNELTYWADKFGVTNVKVKAAVNAVGTSVKSVEAYLKKR